VCVCVCVCVCRARAYSIYVAYSVYVTYARVISKCFVSPDVLDAYIYIYIYIYKTIHLVDLDKVSLKKKKTIIIA